MMLDLHIHTTASDGQYTPSEIAVMAKGKNLYIIAITDHDTVKGIGEAREKTNELGLCFLSGIEISTQKQEEIHILGYGIDETNPELVECCRLWEESRLGRGNRICGFFERRNIPVKIDEVKAIAGTGSMGRPHFARWLQEHGYVRDRKEAFERFLDTPEFHEETDRVKPTPEEAIAYIHRAGGKAVLAHPGLLKMNIDGQEKLVEVLKESGLDGLECFYSRHNAEQAKYYLSLADKYHLKVSAGSDFHGENVKPDVKLGISIPKEKVLDKMIFSIQEEKHKW